MNSFIKSNGKPDILAEQNCGKGVSVDFILIEQKSRSLIPADAKLASHDCGRQAKSLSAEFVCAHRTDDLAAVAVNFRYIHAGCHAHVCITKADVDYSRDAVSQR
jgi:hypothetical protein